MADDEREKVEVKDVSRKPKPLTSDDFRPGVRRQRDPIVLNPKPDDKT